MTPKPRYRRTNPDVQPPTTPVPPSGGPVVVPVVEFTISADGVMSVTVDGAPYLPQPFAPGWRRESFPAILDTLAARHRTPLRDRPAPNPGKPPSLASVTPPMPATQSVLHQVAGSGFVPGEDVAVAIIYAHSDASPDGTARALLTAEQAATAVTGEVILLGRVSGALAISRLP